jgi:hypothetical protein
MEVESNHGRSRGGVSVFRKHGARTGTNTGSYITANFRTVPKQYSRHRNDGLGSMETKLFFALLGFQKENF